MRIKFCLLNVLAALLFLSSSCDNTLDLTADYKDISFTYAMLDLKDTVHYFKIYKGFLTDENAFEAAYDWGNIYYPVDSIEVRLEEYSEDGVRLRSAVLDTTTQVEKQSGSFANPRQLLYYSTWQLDKDHIYRLVIRHVNTGEEVYAETPLVGNTSFRYPMQTWNMNQDKASTIRFYAAKNAAAYDLYLNFHYVEVNKETGAVAHKVISKKINSDFIRSTTSDEVSYVGFVPKSLYTIIAQNLEPDDKVVRYIDAIDGYSYNCIRLQLWAANKTFLDYYNVSHPNSSIVQNRLEYTNFISGSRNAYGILASRNYCSRDLQFSPMEHNEDTLVMGAATGHLGFRYYRESPLAGK